MTKPDVACWVLLLTFCMNASSRRCSDCHKFNHFPRGPVWKNNASYPNRRRNSPRLDLEGTFQVRRQENDSFKGTNLNRHCCGFIRRDKVVLHPGREEHVKEWVKKTLNKLCSLSINQVLTVIRYSVATFHHSFFKLKLNPWAWTPYPPTDVTLAAMVTGFGPLEIKYNHVSARKDPQTPALSVSTSFSQNLTLSAETLVQKNHYAFHSNQTRFLSNYFWSQPSWPGHCLSLVARESIGQNSPTAEREGYVFFMCNAPLSAYMPPQRRLHDGSVLILINT